MITARFSNKTGSSIQLVVEPWATEIPIAPGSHFAVHYAPPGDREDCSHAEMRPGIVCFWCEGDTFEVEIDGERIET